MLVKSFTKLLITLFFLALTSGCVSTAFSGANVVYRHKYLQDNVSDYTIRIRSWNQLRKQYPSEILKGVHLTCLHRIVLLTGQVPNDSVRCQIEATLKTIPNIAKIYNAITVGSLATTKEQLNDSWLTTKVKSKIIASNDIYADKIVVVTEKQIVYLVGIVTQQEGQCAIELAKSTDGVKQVVTIFYYMTMPEIN